MCLSLFKTSLQWIFLSTKCHILHVPFSLCYLCTQPNIFYIVVDSELKILNTILKMCIVAQECPSGVIALDKFKKIYADHFPGGISFLMFRSSPLFHDFLSYFIQSMDAIRLFIIQVSFFARKHTSIHNHAIL